MKKFTLILSIVFAFSVFSVTGLQAQNAEPEKGEAISHNDLQSIIKVSSGLTTTEERKVNVVVEDHKPD